MMSIATQFTVLLLVHCVGICVLGQGQDLTLQPGQAGTNVVLASIGLIQGTGIFDSDNLFLRRLAFAETRDGVDINTYREGYDGGIWQVDENIFDETQDTAAHPELLQTYTALSNSLEIDWPSATWADLRRPLFSALAARLFFSIVAEDIPMIGDLQGQAEYWKAHFNSDPDDTVQDFIDSINELEFLECPVRGLDLVFVLDSSGSVGSANFALVRNFVADVTNTFEIGLDETRVAVITFSGIARSIFQLNTHSNRSSLLQGIQDIPFMDDPGPSTNTADALNLLGTDTFTPESGARDPGLAIPRVAIVVTDGQSNINSDQTIPNAQAVHAAGVVVFAVGVGNSVDLGELNGIASDLSFVSLLTDFDTQELLGLQRLLSFEACLVPAVVDIEQTIMDILDGGEVSFFEYLVPPQGMTIALEVAEGGSAALYASSQLMNPNSAFYDYMIETDSSAAVYVDPSALGDSGVVKRQATNITIYVSIEGIGQSNPFSLTTTFGDTTSSGCGIKVNTKHFFIGLLLVAAVLFL